MTSSASSGERRLSSVNTRRPSRLIAGALRPGRWRVAPRAHAPGPQRHSRWRAPLFSRGVLPGRRGRHHRERQSQPHDPVLDARRIRGDAGVLGSGPLDNARVEPHLPGVQRADDRVAGHDAIAQRSALVGALVVGRQKPIAKIEDGDLTSGQRDRASFAQRARVSAGSRASSDIVHASTFSMG